jgi:hypothetical protein
MGTRAVMQEPVQPRMAASGRRASLSLEEKEAVLNGHNSGARRLALLKAVASLARSLSLSLSVSVPLPLSGSLARALSLSPSPPPSPPSSLSLRSLPLIYSHTAHAHTRARGMNAQFSPMA